MLAIARNVLRFLPAGLLIMLVIWLAWGGLDYMVPRASAASVNFSSDITIDPIDFSITASTSTSETTDEDAITQKELESLSTRESWVQNQSAYDKGFTAYETSTAEILAVVDEITDTAADLASELNISTEGAQVGDYISAISDFLDEAIQNASTATERESLSDSYTKLFEIKNEVEDVNKSVTGCSEHAINSCIANEEYRSQEYFDAIERYQGEEALQKEQARINAEQEQQRLDQLSSVELTLSETMTSTVGSYIDSLVYGSEEYFDEIENYYGEEERQKRQVEVAEANLAESLLSATTGDLSYDEYLIAYEDFYGAESKEKERLRLEKERLLREVNEKSKNEIGLSGGLTSTVGAYIDGLDYGSTEYLDGVLQYYGPEYLDKVEEDIQVENERIESERLIENVMKLSSAGLQISDSLTSTVGDYIAILEEGSEEHLNAVEEYYGTEYRGKVEQDIQMEKSQKQKELEQDTLRLEEETFLQQISEKGNVELTLLDGMTTTVVSMVDSLAYGSDDHLEAIEEHYGVEYLERVEKDIENQIMLQKVTDAEYGSDQYLIAFEEYYGEAAAEVEKARLNEEKLIQKVTELSSIEIMMVSAGLTSTVGTYISKLDYGSSYHLRELERFYGDEYRYKIEQEIERERLDEQKNLEEEELLTRIQELNSTELTVTSKGITSTDSLTISDESLTDTEEIPTSVEEIGEEVSGPDDVIDITDTESSMEVAAVEENIDAENSDVIDLIQLVNPEEEIPLELNSAVVNELNELGYSFIGHRRH